MTVESWVMEVESWVMEIESWVMAVESWVMAVESWVMEVESWVMAAESSVITSQILKVQYCICLPFILDIVIMHCHRAMFLFSIYITFVSKNIMIFTRQNDTDMADRLSQSRWERL